MPTMKQIFRTKKETGASTFKEVCNMLDLEMATRPSALPQDEREWTDEQIALDACTVSMLYSQTIESMGWSTDEFNYVFNRMPDMGERG